MDTDTLIDKLTEAATFRFKEDKTCPGVTISKIKNNKGYYCSIVRYDGAFAKGKEVICKVRAQKLSEALLSLAQKFVSLSVTPKDPVQQLSDELSK